MTDNSSSDTMKTTSTTETTTTTTTESNGHPEKLWLYEENIKQLYELDQTPDRKSFLDDFFNYRKKNGLYSKIPVIARRPLDVYALYCIVQKYGGFESTMKNRMWSQIARELDLPRTMTSGAFTLKLKYIRLLYQFECHKCNKPINQAILYNESMLGDTTKERYEEHVEEYNVRNHQYQQQQTTTSSRDEFEDYMLEKEKIYREALRRSTEKEYIISTRHEQEAISSKSLPTIEERLPMSANSYTNRYRSPPDKSVMLKRAFHVNETKDEDDIPGKRQPRTSNIRHAEDLFKTFSVDFFEITDDLLTIKVRLNDERYEGVLKCC